MNVTNITHARETDFSITREDAALAAFVATVGVGDILVTLPHWHLEANPIALALGPTLWAAVKLTLIAATVAIWFAGAREHWLAPQLAAFVAGTHFTVVLLNLSVAGVIA